MADFTRIPHIFQSWDTDSSSRSAGCLNEPLHPYASYQQGGRCEQPGYHPVVAPADGSRSADTPPQYAFDQRLSPSSKQSNHPKSFHGWNGKRMEQTNYYNSCDTTSSPEYSYPKYDYIYADTNESTAGHGQLTSHDSSAYQQSYYFYNCVPVPGPNHTSHSSKSRSTIYKQAAPSATLVFDQYTNKDLEAHSKPVVPLSPPATKSEVSNISVSQSPKDSRTTSPLIQCTFAYYEPPKPSERKSTAKKKKPAMACLFCRVRKIACAPPVPGSLETRCNQCARRGIDCEYPKESKRGQYRRLQYLERVGKEVAEKIAEVEKSAMSSPSDHKKGVFRRSSDSSQPY